MVYSNISGPCMGRDRAVALPRLCTYPCLIHPFFSHISGTWPRRDQPGHGLLSGPLSQYFVLRIHIFRTKRYIFVPPLSTTRHSYFCEIDNAPGHWNSVSPARTRVCVLTTKNLPTHWYFESLTKHGPSTSRTRPFYVWIDNNASSY